MPPKKKKSKRRTKRLDQEGAGLWDALKRGYDWVRKNKVISKGLGAIANVTGNEMVRKAGGVAGQLGFGKKRRKRRSVLSAASHVPGGIPNTSGVTLAGPALVRRARRQQVGGALGESDRLYPKTAVMF